MTARDTLERRISSVGGRLSVAARLLWEGDGTRGDRLYDAAGSLIPRRLRPPVVQSSNGGSLTDVDVYWGHYNVNPRTFPTARASLRHLNTRLVIYPFVRELMDLWGNHQGHTLLDFGCGPGEDTLGFALFSGAERIIGIDLSEKALTLAAQRMALHRVDPARIELIQVSDTAEALPLEDESIDHIHCLGVLHHASDPGAKLSELFRVLRPGGTARVMIYSRDSVYFHVCVAYERHLLLGEYSDFDVDEAFQYMTDGPDCPISIAYRPGDWLTLCQAAGFEADYLGGYIAVNELDALARLGLRALSDERLDDEHRDFVRSLTWDENGYPLYGGLPAGVNGSYLLRRP